MKTRQLLPLLMFIPLGLMSQSCAEATAVQTDAPEAAPQQKQQQNTQTSIAGKWNLVEMLFDEERLAKDGVTVTKKTAVESTGTQPYLWLKEDGTGEMFMFGEKDSGKWRYDSQSKTLYFSNPNDSGREDGLTVEKLSADSLILSINGQKGNMDPTGLIYIRAK